MVVDPLVGVAGDEHVVGQVRVGHGPEHLPVRGAEVLGLVDDDVPVPVAEVTHAGAVVAVDEVLAADLLLVFAPGSDLRGAFDLEPGSAL